MYLCDDNGDPFNAETFDFDKYLAEVVPDPRMLEYPQGRRELTRYDPLLFAVVYGRSLITSEEGNMSFGDLHLELCRKALEWTVPLKPKASRHVFVAGRGGGKALSLDTPIPTPSGWTTMGELRVGDEVFDESGNPTRVTRATDVMHDHQCYRVTFSDGDEIIADAGHRWNVDIRRGASGVTLTTEDMAGDFETVDSRGFTVRRYSTGVNGSLELPRRYFDIHPYALGAWLGDGSSSGGAITSGRGDVDEMETFLRDAGEAPNRNKNSSGNYSLQLVRRNPHQCIRGHSFSERAGRGNPCRVCIAQWMKNDSRKKRGAEPAPMSPIINETFKARLRNQGLLGNKHIPNDYLRASKEQRLQLLQGLMDTDGYISESGGCTYSGTNKTLVYGVLELVRSLGIRASLNEGRSKLNGVDYGTCYNVSFTTDLPVFRLSRKLSRLRPATGRASKRFITGIEKVDSVPVRCIQVEAKSHLFLAGRGFEITSNSTWSFKLLPMWAAAHGHRKFIAAFSDSATQAQKHLSGWKRLLDSSPLLQADYPDLADPKRRPNGNAVADNTEMYEAKSGFTFSAKGIDTGVLGLTNSENVRPDCILMDDIEKGEANYSPYLAKKRLTEVLDTLLPMNPRAAIFFVGTVTMPESIVHKLVKSVVYPNEQHESWITSEKFQVHYLKPIVKRPDGTERSYWPEVFPLDFFKEQEHTREYKKNYLNLPVSGDEEYWSESDFQYGGIEAEKVLLQIDPAVTSKRESDETAFAVVAFQKGHTEVIDGQMVSVPARCEVREVVGYRLPPERLRQKALEMLVRYPEIEAIRIEVNQGGDIWKSIFKDMPVRVLVHRESVPKKVRAMNLLNFYQSKRVLHRGVFRDLEDQMKSFPHVHHDDLIDAVGAGVHFFLAPRKKLQVSSTTYRRRI